MCQDNPQLSTRQTSRKLDFSQKSGVKILPNNKFRPCKVKLAQELADDDFCRHEEFAEYKEIL